MKRKEEHLFTRHKVTVDSDQAKTTNRTRMISVTSKTVEFGLRWAHERNHHRQAQVHLTDPMTTQQNSKQKKNPRLL
ncbi:hypothetical protein NECAME_11255 [Necator americanus]|uniref:Uncharacterized protein n=1 Tax=Necator americanus TaxID=51031 RepID=W2T669_NECAM|nr:hypothetical protein NECAME_11255 [Necator americanus]ETN77119.1 hypothetical protein NECAME_11255 [Necator americanus]